MAPLKKSHSEFGFKEPFIYFNPSIGISEIELTNSDLLYEKNDNLYLYAASMSPNEGGTSLHILLLDKNYQLLEKYRHEFYSRLRDIIYFKKNNMLLVFNESNGSLIFIMSQNHHSL